MPRGTHSDGQTADGALAVGKKVNANFQRLFNRHAISDFVAGGSLKAHNVRGHTPRCDIARTGGVVVTSAGHMCARGGTASTAMTGAVVGAVATSCANSTCVARTTLAPAA